MKNLFRHNGLSIILLTLFLLVWAGQYVTGWMEYNQDQREHNRAEVTFVGYATESHFLEATFENWESEFLQMAAFVILTIFLYQKGSAESKDPEKSERVDKIKKNLRKDGELPVPVRRGGIALALYRHSLSIALLLLFGASFVMHGVGGMGRYNAERTEHGQPSAGLIDYMSSATFWFESFQNWQSEFLAIAVMVIFTIFLRQQGSPESKPVDAPHGDTGTV